MKSIDGRATAAVGATPAECFSLLEAVDDYPQWTRGLVREVTALHRDATGRASSARLEIHVAQSPFAQDFIVPVSVRIERDRAVWLTRLPEGPSDREELEIHWSLSPDAGTRIDVSFHTVTALVPRFVPLLGVGDQIAAHLLKSAVQELDMRA
jgi:ribosome-associated toxin RatA of RatAB toxin-antitoxin module